VETIVGSLIFKPCDMVEPGKLSHTASASDRLVIGEVDNALTPRLEKIATDMNGAGLKCEVSSDIRKSKWTKLLNNAVWNPLCALTQSGNNQVARFAPTRELAAAMIAEAKAVAASVGIVLDVDPQKTADDMAKRPPATSSTLADVRFGRQLELDALCRSVIEMADLTGVPVPFLRAITACAGLLDQRIVEDGVCFRPLSVRHRRPHHHAGARRQLGHALRRGGFASRHSSRVSVDAGSCRCQRRGDDPSCGDGRRERAVHDGALRRRPESTVEQIALDGHPGDGRKRRHARPVRSALRPAHPLAVCTHRPAPHA
jgi:hypothetical protein